MLSYDVVIVGGGISGCATAIKLKEEALLRKVDISIAVLEKGSSIGANIISGCVMDTVGLDELIPNWRVIKLVEAVPVIEDSLFYLTASSDIRLPHLKKMSSKGGYVVSLSQLCIKLAEYAEKLGVEFYPGFPVADLIFENGRVIGVKTGAVGLDRNSEPKPHYEPGVDILAKQTVLAEGARGSVTKKLFKEFGLDKECCPQTFGLGIKEIWQIEAHKHKLGCVEHFIGYPLKSKAYGGGFIYHMIDNKISIGLVTALDYKIPSLSPFGEFQKFKLHPKIKPLLMNGKRLEYGARVVTEGGWQAIPQLVYPGGVLVGDCAGFLNVAKAKGVHNAIRSGILAAKSIVDAIVNDTPIASGYQDNFSNSNLYKELYQVRNIRPSFRAGLHLGLLYTAFEQYVLRGRVFWTFKWKRRDNENLKHKNECLALDYPKPDGVITFDKVSSVHLANLNYDDSQPCHLKLKSNIMPIQVNWSMFGSPEEKYCPAGVYEIVKIEGEEKLQINSQNCVHCKACDVKDPMQNITWTPPEAGSGPQYIEM